jgi:hypothetical protein
MGALELSRTYYLEVADPAIRQEFSSLYPRLAVGLVGNGSERFGFDDELSEDHDWGVDFYVWTTEADRGSIPALQQWKTRLFAEHPPRVIKTPSPYSLEVTAMSAGDFYRQLIGCPTMPNTLDQWLHIPEENLALATNGEVWLDGAGEFTQTRADLLRFFPEDLRRKRMAARCMELAQTGQYNHQRMAQRRELVAVQLTLSRFAEAAMALAFLLNKVYRPYYKWQHRALKSLPLLGEELAVPLQRLALATGFGKQEIERQQEDIQLVCALLIVEIRAQGLSSSPDWYMTAQGEEIQSSITDDRLRNLPAQLLI